VFGRSKPRQCQCRLCTAPVWAWKKPTI